MKLFFTITKQENDWCENIKITESMQNQIILQ